MSGDYSRDSFDPRKHFNGLLQQQGRVHLESNANELVRIVDRRLRAQAADTLGRAVVSRQTPRGFQITMTNGSLTIGRGRMYVDGLLVENHGKGATTFDDCLAEQLGDDIDYDEQPYLEKAATVAPLPTQSAGPHLAYIVAYERELTHHANPALVESAIGQDTVTALQTVWQVRVLASVPAGTTCATPDDQIPEWQALIRPSGGRLTTHTVDVPEETDPCIIVSGGGRYRGLENQLYRVEIQQGGPIGTATFKWSRENASVATTVIAASGKTLTVASIGKDSVLRIHDGDWVEITDDWRELAGEPPEMRKVSNVDFAARTFEIDAPLPAAFPVDGRGKLTAERHTRIRRWDQNGTNVDAAGGTIPVPAAGERVALEHGVEVSFDVEATGEFKPGDFWTFAASIATANVQPLDKAPPRGIHRHYARLAVITSPTAATDCRVLWPSQTEKPANRPLRVKDVSVAGASLQNDTDIQASVLAQGIIIHFTDGEPNPLAVRGKPVCHVTLDLPYPLNDTDINMWAGLRAPGLLGTQPLVLSGFALAEENRIHWAPHTPVKEWLSAGALFERLRQREYEPRILARLTLKGNFIWSRESPDRYLDGDTFGRLSDGSVEWLVPSGDGQRGGDFQIWFWVTR